MKDRIQKSYLLPLPSHVEERSLNHRALPVSQKRLLVFAAFSDLNAISMRMILSIQSSLILDFRAYPRFDIETFSRRKAFDIMKKHHIKYQDMAGLLGVDVSNDARLNPAIVAQFTYRFIEEEHRNVVTLLFDDKSLLDYTNMILSYIRTNSRSTWVHCVAAHR